ncbi:MAG: dephospho-CoA kinase [bacterium]
MFLFGITGGIGSGKTTVCNLLKAEGVPIIEADPLAKELTNTLPQIRHALVKEFGEDIYNAAGQFDKRKLNQLVFADPATRKRVEQIIHPHVLHHIREKAKRLADEERQTLIGVEAALIYESQLDKMLDAVVVVTAPLDKRVAWLQKRNPLSREEIIQRMQAQMPESETLPRADYVVSNEGSLAELKQQSEKLLQWLLTQTDF